MNIRKKRVLRKDGISRQENKKIYSIWRSIYLRCTDEKHPNYKDYGGKGIKICTDWGDHEVFRNWYIENYIPNWQLDKDIRYLYIGNKSKEYSPETCCFIPSYINQWFGKTSKLPKPEIKFNKFAMSTSVTECGVRTKTYISADTEAELLDKYFQYKDEHIKSLLDNMLKELDCQDEITISKYLSRNIDVIEFLKSFNTKMFLLK